MIGSSGATATDFATTFKDVPVPMILIDFAFEKGAAMAVGTAAARRVGLGWKTDAPKDLMIDSYKLQDAAVSWTAGAP